MEKKPVADSWVWLSLCLTIFRWKIFPSQAIKGPEKEVVILLMLFQMQLQIPFTVFVSNESAVASKNFKCQQTQSINNLSHKSQLKCPRGAVMVPIKALTSCNPFLSRNFSHQKLSSELKECFLNFPQTIFAVSHQHSVRSFIPVCSLLISIAWGRQRGAPVSLEFFKYFPKFH